MIIAKLKPFDEIKEMLKDYRKILVLGCGSCVAVCMAGGEKEAGLLTTQLQMAFELDKSGKTVETITILRQCDREYIEEVKEKLGQYDAILSIACGVGVQFTAEVLDGTKILLPGLNTTFLGATAEPGTWVERCLACGDCVLDETGGVCPVTMCSKSLMNGPCGGHEEGKCEVERTRDCGWVLIYERLKKLNKLDLLKTFKGPKNYGAVKRPDKIIHEAYQPVAVEKEEAKDKK
ncbi:MAG: methylenetetrahydrofolate reductase C-terminal domain-containing protein [Planctomycetes bacterium]|nr:methylenetetrahydrofolate reductase C-terminal domain-containing protein [Planctomycetota bacterium]